MSDVRDDAFVADPTTDEERAAEGKNLLLDAIDRAVRARRLRLTRLQRLEVAAVARVDPRAAGSVVDREGRREAALLEHTFARAIGKDGDASNAVIEARAIRDRSVERLVADDRALHANLTMRTPLGQRVERAGREEARVDQAIGSPLLNDAPGEGDETEDHDDEADRREHGPHLRAGMKENTGRDREAGDKTRRDEHRAMATRSLLAGVLFSDDARRRWARRSCRQGRGSKHGRQERMAGVVSDEKAAIVPDVVPPRSPAVQRDFPLSGDATSWGNEAVFLASDDQVVIEIEEPPHP